MSAVRGFRINVDGRTEEWPVTGLRDMQRAVGGSIEPVPFGSGVAYVNEEGLLLNLPENAVASRTVGARLFGPVLFLGPVDAEGQETDVAASAVEKAVRHGAQGPRPLYASPEQHVATFGVQYGRSRNAEKHPTLPQVTGQSWLEVVGADAEQARAIVQALTGGAYAFMYTAEEFFAPSPSGRTAEEMYPDGCVLRITVER